MKQDNRPYSIPVVVKSNPADWFVYFEYIHEGKKYKRKLRQGINRFKDLKERAAEAEGLRSAREIWLSRGWNPIADPEFKSQNLVNTESLKVMSFSEAIDFALEKKSPDLAKKSIVDYRNILKFTKEIADKIGLSFIPIQNVTRLHILTLLQKLFEEREMSNHRYNMYLRCIRSMLSVLEEWTIINYNPATKIKNKPLAESNFYEAFTHEEKIKISEQLAKHNTGLLVLLEFIYHTGIRPKELLAMQVKDIDINSRTITLTPDLKKETTKTKFIRSIPISNALMAIITEMKLDTYSREYFVHGKMYQTSRRNSKQYLLAPSEWQASRDRVDIAWRTLIISKETGLGINKKLYAGKRTGADDKILAGIDLDALRNLYGHRSKQMTEIYAKGVKELYNSTIITNSPAFTNRADK